MPATPDRLRHADRWLPLRRLSPRGRRPFALVLHDVPDRAWFGDLLDALQRHARLVDVETLVSGWEAGTLRGDELLLTFDDGFRTVHDVVEPECAARGVPYVAFVLSEVLDGPAPWTARLVHLLRAAPAAEVARALGLPPGPSARVLALAKEWPIDEAVAAVVRAEAALGIDPAPLRERYLTPAQVQAIHAGGLGTIGLHTHRHATLSRCDLATQRAEIATNRDRLHALTGARPRWFAYPNGMRVDFDPGTVRLLGEEGIAGAFTTILGPLDASEDRYRLRRLGLNPGDPDWKLVLRTALPWVSVGMWREARWRLAARARRAP